MRYLKIFTDFMDVVAPLSDGAAGRLFKAMLRYALDGTLPLLKGKEGMAFTVARQHMDREAQVYERRVKHLKQGPAPVTEQRYSVTEQRYSVTEQDKDKEKDNDKDKDKDKDSLSTGGAGAPEERERRPTLSEVMEFSQREGIQTDVEYFYNYYAANGWHMGKQPIRNWKAALRAWARKEPILRPAPAKEPLTDREVFQKAIELHRRKEAKQV